MLLQCFDDFHSCRKLRMIFLFSFPRAWKNDLMTCKWILGTKNIDSKSHKAWRLPLAYHATPIRCITTRCGLWFKLQSSNADIIEKGLKGLLWLAGEKSIKYKSISSLLFVLPRTIPPASRQCRRAYIRFTVTFRVNSTEVVYGDWQPDTLMKLNLIQSFSHWSPPKLT